MSTPRQIVLLRNNNNNVYQSLIPLPPKQAHTYTQTNNLSAQVMRFLCFLVSTRRVRESDDNFQACMTDFQWSLLVIGWLRTIILLVITAITTICGTDAHTHTCINTQLIDDVMINIPSNSSCGSLNFSPPFNRV